MTERIKLTLVTRVLVVDCNVVDAETIAELLRAYGHDVSVATAWRIALNHVSTFSPRVVLMDLGLPEMDGYELARRILTSGSTCRLIAVTGHGRERDRVRATEAGFFAHLLKPITTAALLSAVSEELDSLSPREGANTPERTHGRRTYPHRG